MIGSLSRWRDNGRVETYTVHEPPDTPADRIDRAEKIVLLKDGFSWGAFLLGPLWLLARGEWIGLAAYLAAAIVLAGFFTLIGAGPAWTGLAVLALNAFVGFEAASLARWSMGRAGWNEIGTVSGRNLAECERRFFESWLPGQPVIAARDARRPAGTLAASAGEVGQRPAGAARRGWRGLLSKKA